MTPEHPGRGDHPRKGLLEIEKVLEQGPNARLAVKTPHAFVVQDDIAIAVELIDAQFPPCEQVISRDHKKMKAALQRPAAPHGPARGQRGSTARRRTCDRTWRASIEVKMPSTRWSRITTAEPSLPAAIRSTTSDTSSVGAAT